LFASIPGSFQDGGIMKKHLAMFVTVFFMQGASAVYAGNFIPYVSVGGGLFSTTYAEVGPSGGLEMIRPTWGTFIKAGVDMFQYTGVEIRAGITGKASQAFPAGTLSSTSPLDVSAQLTSFVSYLGKLQFPITQKVKVYGLLGATYGRISADRNQSAGGAFKGWKTALSYGGGIEYKFRSRGSIGLEWVQYWNKTALPAIPPSTTSQASFSGASLMINKFF